MASTINIPANQVLAKPVSSYYKGKAIRQQFAAGEQDAKIRDLQIDQAEYEKTQRGKPDTKEIRDQEKHAREQKKAQAGDVVAGDYAGIQVIKDGGSIEDATVAQRTAWEEGLNTPSTKGQIPDDYAFDEAQARARISGYEKTIQDEGGTDTRTAIQKNLDPLRESGAITQEQYDAMIIASHTKAEPSAPAPSEADKKIERFQRVLGLSEEMSVKLAYGVYSVKPNSVTGAVQVIDEAGQVVQEIPVERDDIPVPSPDKGKTLWDYAQYASGPINTLTAAVSVPLAWAGMSVNNKVIEARQTFATTNQGFIRALVNNKRYPVAEVNRIMEEINLVPKFLDDPKLMRIRMGALRDSLSLVSKQATKDAENPNNPSKMRAGATQAASDINNYLAVLGEPTAPQAALDALASGADGMTIEAFEEYYGYRPEGY